MNTTPEVEPNGGSDPACDKIPRPDLPQLRRTRLESALATLGKLIAFKEATSELNDSQKKAVGMAKDSHGTANRCFKKHRDEVAWAHCKQAYRFLIWAFDKNDIEAHRRALRREAETKLKSWRREAVLDVLGRDVAGSAEIGPAELSLAQFLFDLHYDNAYFKLEAAAVRIRKLPFFLGALIVLLIMGSFLGSVGDGDLFLVNPRKILLVMLVGVVGAALSNTLSVLGVATRIPEFVGEFRSWLVRPLIGALSAVGVVLVVQSGILPLKEPTGAALYAWGLAGGFSDQLLNRVMQQVEKKAKS